MDWDKGSISTYLINPRVLGNLWDRQIFEIEFDFGITEQLIAEWIGLTDFNKK